MRPARSLSAVLAAALLVVLGGVLSSPPPVHPQTPDVWLNIIGQAKKINIAIPDFTLVSGTDSQGLAKQLPGVAGKDLTFSALFTVVSGVPALPANNPAALREAWANFATAGAHAGLQGLLTL